MDTPPTSTPPVLKLVHTHTHSTHVTWIHISWSFIAPLSRFSWDTCDAPIWTRDWSASWLKWISERESTSSPCQDTAAGKRRERAHGGRRRGVGGDVGLAGSSGVQGKQLEGWDRFSHQLIEAWLHRFIFYMHIKLKSARQSRPIPLSVPLIIRPQLREEFLNRRKKMTSFGEWLSSNFLQLHYGFNDKILKAYNFLLSKSWHIVIYVLSLIAEFTRNI